MSRQNHVPDDQYRCQANTINHWFSPSERCRSKQMVQVGEKRYCRKHGGLAALSVMIDNGDAKDLTREGL